jgi:N-acetylmuramoyl-L-alanine amidase
MSIAQTPSPNFGDRRDGKAPRFLILHYTDMPTAQEALARMQDSTTEVSAHYLVDTDGAVMQLVDEKKRAWHAGKSFWAGEADMNSASIGIEVQNPGHSNGYIPFPDAQVASVIALCKDIVARHGIAPQDVLAHSDIAPGRKEDPGHLFPWKKLAENGVGLWPQAARTTAPGNTDTLLTHYGYDPEIDLRLRIAAFQRHFEPAVFGEPGAAGTETAHTNALLADLLRQCGRLDGIA